MTLKWNGEAATAALEDEAARRLLAAGVTLQTAHMARLGVDNPPPYLNSAAKGDYPHRRTGFGQGSVVCDPTSIAEIKRSWRVRVGYLENAKYMAFLAGRGWKGVWDTAVAIKDQLVAILGAGGEVTRG